MERLCTPYLDAYICHSPKAAGDPEVAEAMASVKAKGLVRHIGYSVYEAEEARRAVSAPETDFIQLPYSILDQRMKKQACLKRRNGKASMFMFVPSSFRGLP